MTIHNTRRKLIQATSSGTVLGALAGSGIRIAHSQTSDAPGRLVVLMLRGAMDGLSLVAPYGDANYYRARTNIAIARPGEVDGLLALDNLFGLHPAAATLMPYWESKKLAFVHASGSPDPTRSHFDAQDYMESGTPGRKSTRDGWLNRLASVLSSTQQPARLQAVNLGPTMPRIFSGDAAVSSLASGNAAIAKGVLDRPDVAAAFSELYSGGDKLSQSIREASLTRKEIINTLVSDDPNADVGSLPLVGLAQDTARLGQLMARDARVRLAFVPVGGWDTHVNQGGGKGQLANRFALLSGAVDALIKGLGDRFAQTTILVMSEFGRTVRQNGTNGTDHGHGNVAWVLGGKVNGGKVLGHWPGLEASALYEGRDLAITTDFRHIIAELLEREFRLSDTQLSVVLPNMPRRQSVSVSGDSTFVRKA